MSSVSHGGLRHSRKSKRPCTVISWLLEFKLESVMTQSTGTHRLVLIPLEEIRFIEWILKLFQGKHRSQVYIFFVNSVSSNPRLKRKPYKVVPYHSRNIYLNKSALKDPTLLRTSQTPNPKYKKAIAISKAKTQAHCKNKAMSPGIKAHETEKV